mmetsp:Transcript_78730/g.202830  ORF Transcript_78730/g.202830 Transcript_78730/m.202830 type:complete len:324 (-) Transcript_78730:347-1318(-)
MGACSSCAAKHETANEFQVPVPKDHMAMDPPAGAMTKATPPDGEGEDLATKPEVSGKEAGTVVPAIPTDVAKAYDSAAPCKDLMSAAAAAVQAAASAPLAAKSQAESAGLIPAKVAAAAAQADAEPGRALTNLISVPEPRPAEAATPAWHLRPSVGTWCLPKQVFAQAAATPKAEPPAAEPAVAAKAASPPAAAARLPMRLLPSVGTWMQRPITVTAKAAAMAGVVLVGLEVPSPVLELLDAGEAKAPAEFKESILAPTLPVAVKAKEVAWSKLPSVGTWLAASPKAVTTPKLAEESSTHVEAAQLKKATASSAEAELLHPQL